MAQYQELPEIEFEDSPQTTGITMPSWTKQTNNANISDTNITPVDLDQSKIGYSGIGNAASFSGQNAINDSSLSVNMAKGLLDNNGALTKIAESKASDNVAGRGLLNTNLGQGMIVNQTLEAMQPYVLQDAQLKGQADLSAQEGTINAGLQEQEGRISGALASQAANIEGAKNNQTADLLGQGKKQEGEIAASLASQQAWYDQDMQQLSTMLEGAINSQQWTNEFANTVFQNRMDAMRELTQLQSQEILGQEQLSIDEKEAISTAYMELSKNYEISYQEILLDPDLNAAAKKAAIEEVATAFHKNMQNIAELYSMEYEIPPPIYEEE